MYSIRISGKLPTSPENAGRTFSFPQGSPNPLWRSVFLNFSNRGTVTDKMICGMSNFSNDICIYNAGGPIMVNGSLLGKSQSRRASITDSLLLGLPAFGRWCANRRFPAVWTNVKKFKDWYDEHLKKDYTNECWRGLSYSDRMKHYFTSFLNKFRFCRLSHKASDTRRNVSMICSFPRIFKFLG